jgi:methylthioribose-1-phosphate isomerase
MPRLKTIEWTGGAVRIIDQTRLPDALVYLDIIDIESMVEAIKVLRVRGAPAIGVAAGFGVYLIAACYTGTPDKSAFLSYLEEKSDYLMQARPTAVNLSWAVLRQMKMIRAEAANNDIEGLKSRLLKGAIQILEEDRTACMSIGEHGFHLIRNSKNILTHCNAGGLATSEYGTALAPVYVAADKGLLIHVYSDETRPLLQGSRITAFELSAAGIPVTVICDNMAASLMRAGKIDAVIVGADRIASNGDVANKIGTYPVALAAKANKVPFYVAAPSSTFDLSISDGSRITIEERDPEEVTCGFGKRTAPLGVNVYNPAFDVTPAELVTAIITEAGVFRPPYQAAMIRMFSTT